MSTLLLSRPFAAIAAFVVVVSLMPTTAAQTQELVLEVSRHAGPSRTATATAVSRQSHPAGAATVVIARADTYGDALAAGPLAATLDAPILLSGTDSLDAAAAEEIARLGADRAVLLGDMSDAVAEQVRQAGARQVDRITGGDEWETYAAIAGAVVDVTGATRGLLVEGTSDDPQRGWPDALAASSWAARDQIPVFLTRGDSLPAATRQALSVQGITELTVVGGTVAVSDAVVADAASALPAGVPVDRVAGASRYDTAIAVANQNMDANGYTTSVWVASGRGWPDALVAGPAAARAGGVLVLTDPTSMRHSPQTASFIGGQRGFASSAHLVGGTAVLSEEVADTVLTGRIPSQGGPVPDALGDRPPPVPARNTAPPIADARPWSDPSTWGGRLPVAGDTVTIPADRAVLLDIQPPTLRGIRIEGTLAFADIDLRMDVDWIVVNGRLAIGTEEAPLTSAVEVVLHPRPGDDIDGAGMGPIAVHGGTLDIHGQVPTRPWTRLASTAVAGTTRLTLQQSPGWSAGDEIVVASTSLDLDQAEQRVVVAVDGQTVTLDQPLQFTHWGQTDSLGGTDVRQHAEVGNLSRNIVVRSSADAVQNQQGGHVMVFAGGVAHISGAEFTGLGQTGELARYPIHFHMMGSASGSYVRGSSVHHAFNRCVTIHGTNDVDLTDTIGYETLGHCFFFEDGVETGNLLGSNLGLSTREPAEGMRLLESDTEPSTFWISNPSNHFVGNAAAGSEGHGFWYDLPEAPTGLSQGTDLDIRRLPFGTFADNVAHTSSGDGWKQGIGVFVEDYEPPNPAVFTGITSYKNESFGMWAEGVETTNSTFAENNIGFLGLDSVLRNSTVVGVTSNAGDRTWRLSGVGFYHGRSVISDVTFVNFSQREHDWQHPRTALEFISESNNEVSEVSGATFINANRLAITQPTADDGEVDNRSAAIRDIDGSVSGAPALLSSNNALMFDSSCRWRQDLGANTCPTTFERTWLRIADGLGSPLEGATLTRSDGVTGSLNNTDREPERAYGDVLLNRSYAVSTGRPMGEQVDVVMAGSVEGYVDLTIPWPHASAFVYDGWGRWNDVPAVTSLALATDTGYVLDRAAGVLRIRHTLNDFAEQGRWQRLELCARAFCGNTGPGN